MSIKFDHFRQLNRLEQVSNDAEAALYAEMDRDDYLRMLDQEGQDEIVKEKKQRMFDRILAEDLDLFDE